MSTPIAPGAHIEVRSAIWRVQRVDKAYNGDQAIYAIGVSDLVKDMETIFLKDYEERKKPIRLLNPKETKLVSDTSGNHIASLLHIESHLRMIPPTDKNIYVGNKAALDVMPFQQEPARIALSRPRQRILIADAVGLGKTLSCGILLSELIARGKGKRILVVTLKSMLAQFQKEMWTRFSIPLTRLDSIGLQKIRSHIPTNQNPFYYYDRSIISIDTLKQNNIFKTYLEQAHWDIIVIDESQNVAERGKGKEMSKRADLAKLLAKQSDSLIMLSATPHDGKPESFASLMNMLDPTAIANKSSYHPEDIQGLYVRRFKKDVQHELEIHSPTREVHQLHAPASAEEEAAFTALVNLKLEAIDNKTGAKVKGQQLFKTLLEKSLLSSPQACAQTIATRLRSITNKGAKDAGYAEKYRGDQAELRALLNELETLDRSTFGKYQRLLSLLREKKMDGKENPFAFQKISSPATDDRAIIFTERIETMNFVAQSVGADLGWELIDKDLSNLNTGRIATLHGSMSDVDIQKIVEDFGKEKSNIRLLVASDVASEGLNLHFLCNKLIHFDIPWSLMVFQQRNGRIDRYGQKRTPYIGYLLTTSDHQRIKGDQWVLEKLIDRDKKVQENLGDPASLTGVHTIEEEEAIISEVIEAQATTDETFDPFWNLDNDDWLNDSIGETTQPIHIEATLPTIFQSDYHYLKESIAYLKSQGEKDVSLEYDDTNRSIRMHMPPDLQRRYEKYPQESLSADNHVILLSKKDDMIDAIRNARAEESVWPPVQFLWRLHPTMDWAVERMSQNFGRHAAPIVNVGEALPKEDTVILVSAVIPSRSGHPMLHEAYALRLKGATLTDITPYDDFQQNVLHLGEKKLPNVGTERSKEQIATLQNLLAPAIEAAMDNIIQDRNSREQTLAGERKIEIQKIENLKIARLAHLETLYAENKDKRESSILSAQSTFDNSIKWLREAMTLEEHPFVQVIAVLING